MEDAGTRRSSEIALDRLIPCRQGDVAVFAPLLEASPKLARALQNVGTVGQLAIVSTVDNDDEAGGWGAARAICAPDGNLTRRRFGRRAPVHSQHAHVLSP